MDSSPRHTAADRFFTREKENLKAYIRSRIDLRDHLTAEDIIQDVALNVFTKLDPELPIRRLASYVYASLRNRIIDLMRKRREPTQSIDAENTGDWLTEGPETVEFDDPDPLETGLGIMYVALDRLSPEQVRIIRSTELEGRSFRELSEEMKIPVNTLLSRKHRAMARLSEEMAMIIESDPGGWSPDILSNQ